MPEIVANSVLLARFQIGLFTSHAPSTSIGANMGVALVAVGLTVAAFRAQPRRARTAHLEAASQRTIRLTGVLSGLAWFVASLLLGPLATLIIVLLSKSPKP